MTTENFEVHPIGTGAELQRLRALVAQPAGWKLVPVEPTPEIVKAFQDQMRMEFGISTTPGYHARVYASMLAAAPQQPSPQPCRDCKGIGADNAQTGDEAIPCWVCQGAGQQPAPQPVGWLVDGAYFYLVQQLDRNDQPIPNQIPLYAGHGIGEQPAPQPLTETVDWEHIARLLDAALQELVVFVDERWSDNECRPLENAKHAIGLVKDEW